jgi:hypothetical protein
VRSPPPPRSVRASTTAPEAIRACAAFTAEANGAFTATAEGLPRVHRFRRTAAETNMRGAAIE